MYKQDDENDKVKNRERNHKESNRDQSSCEKTLNRALYCEGMDGQEKGIENIFEEIISGNFQN